MTRLILAAAAASLFTAACGTAASDRDVAVDPNAAQTTVTTTVTTTTREVSRASAMPSAGYAAAAANGRTRPQVTIPAGTVLQLRLDTAVASDTSHVGDAVTAELTSPVVIDGRTVLPAGARVAGTVTDADDSDRVKGRARVAIDFSSLTTGGSRYPITAASVSRQAAATKGEDATKIGIGAGAGAIIGGILGGKKGSAEGAVIGGGAGTGVVLATKGKEVRLAAGSHVSTRLSAPLTLRIS